jgi:hypothetical protein
MQPGDLGSSFPLRRGFEHDNEHDLGAGGKDEEDWTKERDKGAIHRSLSLETRVTLTDIADR